MVLDLKKPYANKTSTDLYMQFLGMPIAMICLCVIWLMPTPNGMSYDAKMVFGMFVWFIVLCITQSIPNWVAGLSLMVLMPLFGVWTEADTLAMLGYDGLWLIITAFVLSAAMEKTGLAKRIALFLICKLGRSAKAVIWVLMIANIITAFAIPSTTARGFLTLPIIMMAIEAFKSGDPVSDTNFGKIMALQGTHGNLLPTCLVLTGTTSQILTVTFLKDMAGADITYSDWLIGGLPANLVGILASLILAGIIFPYKNVKGSNEKFQEMVGEYDKLGKFSGQEIKCAIILLFIIFMWAMDGKHMGMFGFQFSLFMTSIVGAVILAFPHIGIVSWKEIKIPWDMIIFSAGAYSAGLALDDTGLASWILNKLFGSLGLENLPFFAVYAIVIFIAQASGFIFNSKTIRCTVMIPVIINLANVCGVNPILLALPAGYTMCDTICLPMNSKVNLAYYAIGNTTTWDMMKYGWPTIWVKYIVLLTCPLWFQLIGLV